MASAVLVIDRTHPSQNGAETARCSFCGLGDGVAGVEVGRVARSGWGWRNLSGYPIWQSHDLYHTHDQPRHIHIHHHTLDCVPHNRDIVLHSSFERGTAPVTRHIHMGRIY